MGKRRLTTFSEKAVALAVATALAAPVFANPTGPTLVSGAAQMSNPSPSVLQVVNTPGTILNWQSFSIGGGETTRFVQLNAASAVLNRVTGGDPSSILGRLESNGRVFLVNRNGIVFGPSSVVDVAGLIASTRDISNANFTAGNYAFGDPGPGNITLQGGAQILTSGTGGQVWLLARNVAAEAGSRISVPQGQVVLAAGSSVQVGNGNLGEMAFTVTTDAGNTIDALGEIVAQRGAVGFFADAINFGGKTSARSNLEGQGGITALASRAIQVGRGALLDVSADDAAAAGSIYLEAGQKITVDPGGEVLAESLAGQGGTIRLKSYQVDLPAPRQPRESWQADLYRETNQSVRAFGVNAANDGTVSLEESGQFSYSANPVAGAQFTENLALSQPPSIFSGCCFSSAQVLDGARSGDGRTLYVTFERSPGGVSRHVFTIEGGGTTAALGELIPGSAASNAHVDRIWGLAREGWVIAGSQFVRIVRTDGTVGATWNFGDDGFVSVAPLPSGAVWIRKIALDGVTEVASRVYSASGTELTGDARVQALGTVRVVDIARHGGASASGSVFQRREISDTGGDGVTRIVLHTHDLVRGSTALTSLQESRYEETPPQTSSSSLATVLSVGGVSPNITVTWKHENTQSSIGGGYSSLGHTPVSGFGGDGALILKGGASDTLSTTYASTTTNVQGGLDDATGYVAHVNSLNVPNDDGHFYPPVESQSTVVTETYSRQLSWQSGLERLTRSPLAPPVQHTLGASVGQSIDFATRPGAATNTDVPPSGAPPVVTGSGSGASFAGVAAEGCNAAVCSPEVRAAVALVSATRGARAAAEAFSAGNIAAAATEAENAVRAVWTEVVNRRASPEDIQREEEAILRDQREVEKLVQELSAGLWDLRKKGLTAVQEQLEKINQVVKEYTEREMLYQQTGLSRTVPNERKLFQALLNMNAEERQAFGQTLVTLMQTDPTFGEAPAKPAATPAPASSSPDAPAFPAQPDGAQAPDGSAAGGSTAIVERSGEVPMTEDEVAEQNRQDFGNSFIQRDR